jgi:hypothetical protein
MLNWLFIHSVNEKIYNSFLCLYGWHESLYMIMSVVVGFLYIVTDCVLL